MPTRPGAETINLDFVRGSDALSPEAAATAKQVATRLGNGAVIITGHGDADSSDPAVQTAAASLGLARAQAVAKALLAAGVPSAAVNVDAEAAGRGATLRLLH